MGVRPFGFLFMKNLQIERLFGAPVVLELRHFVNKKFTVCSQVADGPSPQGADRFLENLLYRVFEMI